MSLTGERTTTLPKTNVADEVIVNRSGDTRAMAIAQLSAQLEAATGPTYETRAQLYADLAWAAGSVAKVVGDATVAYRGLYKKAGAAGSGSWSRIGPLPELDADGLAGRITAAEQTYAAFQTAVSGQLGIAQTAVAYEQTRAMSVEANLSSADEALQAQIDALGSSGRQRGTWDASSGAFPTVDVQKGDMWYVSAAGTVSAETFGIADQLLSLVNGGGSAFAGNWSRIPTSGALAEVAAKEAANARSRAVTTFAAAAPPLEIILHRGGANAAPENTYLALANAIRMGARSVEFDLCLSATGTPYLHHDTTVDRVTDGTGAITSLTDAAIGALRIRDTFRPPWSMGLTPLVQVLPLLAQAGVRVYPEFKAVRSIDDVNIVVNLFRSFGLSSQVHYGQTNGTWMLERVRSLDPDCALTFFREPLDATFWTGAAIVAGLGRAEIGTHYNLITRSLVNDLAAMGLGILAYTPTQQQHLRFLRAAGCHRIMVDNYFSEAM